MIKMRLQSSLPLLFVDKGEFRVRTSLDMFEMQCFMVGLAVKIDLIVSMYV